MNQSLGLRLVPSLAAGQDVEPVTRAAHALVASARQAAAPIVLAVSGGCDSMVMMCAVADALAKSTTDECEPPIVRVLSFDHATGPAATQAATLVEREATRLGLDVRVGRAGTEASSEAEWRAARWAFFRDASAPGAWIATAHTRDDQIETVFMRALRCAGARGLAGLAAQSRSIVRPFLDVSRAAVRRYGNIRGVPFVEDPTNTSTRYLRNRVRHDLLPAIARLRPRFADELLDVARCSAAWRGEVDALVDRYVSGDVEGGVIRVARAELATYDSSTLCVLWPAIAARASVTLDRRGTLRLAQFTTSGARGARIQLSGGIEVFRDRDSFVVQRRSTRSGDAAEQSLSGALRFGEWRFVPLHATDTSFRQSIAETLGELSPVGVDDEWSAELPSDRSLVVRAWRPADRMRAWEGGAARRVKRFFGDARIPGPSRAGWPVVLVDDEIVWIPGVRRMIAAPERSGRPLVRYACERCDGGIPTR